MWELVDVVLEFDRADCRRFIGIAARQLASCPVPVHDFEPLGQHYITR